MKRAKFLPAHDAAGVPAIGVYKTFIGWWVGENYPPEMWEGDVIADVPDIPSRSKSRAVVNVMFAVDANGTPSNCLGETKLGQKLSDDDLQLVQIACEQVIRTYRAQAAVDASGTAIPSIQDATVILTRLKH